VSEERISTAAAFRAAVERLDIDAACELLAPDVVFHSPVTFHPFVGRDTVVQLLTLVADTFEELKRNVREAVQCHFDAGTAPPVIRLHTVKDEVIST